MMNRFLVLAACLLLSSCFAGSTWQGEESENFDGSRFHNREPIQQNPFDMIRLGYGFLVHGAKWPAWRDIVQQDVSEGRVDEGLSVTFINHSTLLIQVDGINILTDPVYSNRVSPVSFAGPKRIHAPGIPFDELPPIDVILISHNHYDHLDTATLDRLANRGEKPPVVITGLGNRGLIEAQGFSEVVELNWDQGHLFGELEIIFVECRHRSGRGLLDHFKTLWGSFVIKAPSGNVYFAGDTAYGPHFREAGERYGPFALAMLPIGAYEPRWFMKNVHTNPAEAVQAHLDLRSEKSVGIHYGVFQLTYEGVDEPEAELQKALSHRQLTAEEFLTLKVGETRRVR